MIGIDSFQMTLIALSSILLAGFVGLLAKEVIRLVDRDVDLESENWDYDKNRTIELYQGSLTYRCFAPLIHEVMSAKFLDKLSDERDVDLSLRRGGSSLPWTCLLYTSPSPRDLSTSRMPSSA